MLFLHRKIKQRPLRSLKAQRGVVIIIALFIVALVVTMAYVMMARLARDTQRTGLLLRDEQAELYAQGSIAWAVDTLRNNWEHQKQEQLIDRTPIQSPTHIINGYHITSIIYDAQSRLNLNNLTDPSAQVYFKQLMQMLIPTLKKDKMNDIIAAVIDWITPGIQKSFYDNYYFELPTPYRAAHRPMLSASELRIVKGVDSVLYAALRPYIVALPAGTLINVQSAPAQVLAILSPSMTLAVGKVVEQLRSESPFLSTQRFLNLDVIKNHRVSADKITAVSNYFLVETNVIIDQQHLVFNTLVERTTKNDKAAVNILWQSKGEW